MWDLWCCQCPFDLILCVGGSLSLGVAFYLRGMPSIDGSSHCNEWPREGPWFAKLVFTGCFQAFKGQHTFTKCCIHSSLFILYQLMCCVTLGKKCNLSELQFPQLSNENGHVGSAYLLVLKDSFYIPLKSETCHTHTRIKRQRWTTLEFGERDGVFI